MHNEALLSMFIKTNALSACIHTNCQRTHHLTKPGFWSLEMGRNGGKWGEGGWGKLGNMWNHQQISMENVGTISRSGGKGEEKGENERKMGQKFPFFTSHF